MSSKSGRNMSDQYTYARFWRCALQVNPVGYNGTYREPITGWMRAATTKRCFKSALSWVSRLSGWPTHGSVASVDALRQVLQPRGIVVFPGFEIASNDKTHYVCLFSEETTGQQLERYLGNLDLLDPTDGVRPSRLSSEQLIEKVDQLGGFIYAAHCTSDSGLLKKPAQPCVEAPQAPRSPDSGADR
jgi:hypothetical protein